MSGTEPSILWYDLETFGGDPAADPVAQVAWCRTDLALRPLAEPTSLFCRPPWFCLPDPEACLITRITPQQCVAQGVSQHHFTNQLLAELSQPETTSAGYNVIRFDDEFVRHLLWRELLDPYAREWQNGNQRFDLLDAVRMTYALRPEGILWPVRDDGLPSFKLEQLVLANQLPQPRAHDAASDVEATIALARLLKICCTSASLAISGGDRAMTSPVTLISTFSSKKQRLKTSIARAPGAPSRDFSSMAAIRPQLRISLTLAQFARPWAASSKAGASVPGIAQDHVLCPGKTPNGKVVEFDGVQVCFCQLLQHPHGLGALHGKQANVT